MTDSKTCSLCKQEKLITEFYKDKKAKFGVVSRCKLCFNSARRINYLNNEVQRNKIISRNAEHSRNHRKINMTLILKLLKKLGCKDCGEKDPIVLEFDHISDKKCGIAQMVRNHKSWEDIELEIQKCEVRCCNCHRRKTAIERKFYVSVGIDLNSI